VSKSPHKFIPALRFDALTPLYDRLLERTLKEQAFKQHLIHQARILPGQRVLDLGCGTGTLTVMIKRSHPQATVIGLDPDAKALDRAQKKALAATVDVAFHQGFASKPPFEAGTFDRVLSSLMFHHLRPAEKRSALQAVRNLLRPGGEIHIADWGGAQNFLMRAAFLSVQMLDGFETTRDHVRGRLPQYLEQAGFSSVTEAHQEMTPFGTLSFYRGVSR